MKSKITTCLLNQTKDGQTVRLYRGNALLLESRCSEDCDRVCLYSATKMQNDTDKVPYTVYVAVPSRGSYLAEHLPAGDYRITCLKQK